jgi:hypothetical protein
MRLWYSLDFVLHLWDLTGRKVAGRKDDIRELVEHFNVSIFPITQKKIYFLGFVHIYGAY